MGSNVAKSASHKTPAENFIAWERAYNEIKSLNPYAEIRMYQGDADVVEGGFGNQQAYKTYSFDSNDGKITSVLPYSEKERSNHIKGWTNRSLMHPTSRTIATSAFLLIDIAFKTSE